MSVLVSKCFDILCVCTDDAASSICKLVEATWEVFSVLNGNPELNNSGVHLALMLSFSLFLVIVLQLRAKLIFDKKHLVAFVGAILLVFRILVLFGFEWGWQINLYDDAILHFLAPPLEHFFNMMYLLLMVYYTLVLFEYFPGILQRVLKYIPMFIVLFLIWSTVHWKMMFVTNLPEITQYWTCPSDYLTHLILTIIAGYAFVVAIFKYKKYHKYISAFWTIVMIENAGRFLMNFTGNNCSDLFTIFNAMEIFSIGILVLHFIDIYIPRAELPKERRSMKRVITTKIEYIRCSDCIKDLPDGE